MKSNIRFLVVKFGKGFDVQANNLKTLVLITIFMVLLAACGTSRPQLPQEVEESPEEIETAVEAPSDIKIGTDTVRLPGFSEPTEVSYEIIGDYAIYEGDIILGKVNEDGKLINKIETQAFVISDDDYINDFRWPDGLVRYRFAGNWGANTSVIQQLVEEAIEHWESHTSIRFVETSSDAQYVLDFTSNNFELCASGFTGYRDIETLSNEITLDPDDCNHVGVIIHEIGHALGLMHEQNRPGRGQFVDYYRENLKDDSFHGAFKEVSTDSRKIGSYDYDSIMHYGCYARVKTDEYGYAILDENGDPIKTLEPRDLNVGCAEDNNHAFGSGIGQRERLSPGDIAAINWLYLDDWVVSRSDGQNNNAWEQINTDETKLKDIRFADMNNNGTTDVVAIKHPWGAYLVYKEAGQGNNWIWLTQLNGNEKISDFAFGDFNGNGTTDVFYTDGTSWRYKEKGIHPWQTLKHSSIRVSQLGFGDFNGNGMTDVFFVNSNNRWTYNEGGSEYDLGEAQVPFNQLGFGDFNGNGTTDIFMSDSSGWFYIDGGQGPRILLKNTNIHRVSIHFGDFNGDGTTDVFYGGIIKWYVAHGGSGSWEVLNDEIGLPPKTKATSDLTWIFFPEHPQFTFGFGDFDGDGTTDIFKTLKWY